MTRTTRRTTWTLAAILGVALIVVPGVVWGRGDLAVAPARPTTTAAASPAAAASPTPSDGTRVAARSASLKAATPGSTSYALGRTTLADGRSVVLRWNPCQTAVTYSVNVAAVPSASRATVLAEIRTAVDRLSAATGIRYAYKGTTSEVPRTSSIDRQRTELVIAVTTPAKTDIRIGGSTLGYGGYHYWEWERTSSTGRRTAGAVIGRGWVVIDRAGFLKLRPGFGPGAYRGNVLLHELAHTVGLDHVRDKRQLMYTTLLPSSPNGFAAGDRAGLAKVGRSAGCVSVPSGVVKDLS